LADNNSQFAASLMKYLVEIYGELEEQPLCESPIEAMMFWALSVRHALYSEGHITINAQHKIDDYRVDFMVTLTEGHLQQTLGYRVGTPRLYASVIVECDGHDFHEKTKEQARRDKKRDRTLQKLGYNVLRFSGSDIWKDVMKCADECLEFLEAKLHQQDIDIFLAWKGK